MAKDKICKCGKQDSHDKHSKRYKYSKHEGCSCTKKKKNNKPDENECGCRNDVYACHERHLDAVRKQIEDWKTAQSQIKASSLAISDGSIFFVPDSF